MFDAVVYVCACWVYVCVCRVFNWLAFVGCVSLCMCVVVWFICVTVVVALLCCMLAFVCSCVSRVLMCCLMLAVFLCFSSWFRNTSFSIVGVSCLFGVCVSAGLWFG